MADKFNEKHVRNEISSILVDYSIDLPSEELEDLLEELSSAVEDVFYSGYEAGKLVGFEQLKALDELVEQLGEEESFVESFEEIEDDFYFPSEPE